MKKIASPAVLQKRFALNKAQLREYTKKRCDGDAREKYSKGWMVLPWNVAIGEIIDRAKSFIDEKGGYELIDCFLKNTDEDSKRFPDDNRFALFRYADTYGLKYFVGGTHRREPIGRQSTFSIALGYWYDSAGGVGGGAFASGGINLKLFVSELRDSNRFSDEGIYNGHFATVSLHYLLSEDKITWWQVGAEAVGREPLKEGSLDFLLDTTDDIKIRVNHYKRKSYGLWKYHKPDSNAVTAELQTK